MKTTSDRKCRKNISLAKKTRPVLKPKNRGGAPKGNTNALRHGRYTGQMRARRAALNALIARSRAMIAVVDAICAERHRAEQTAAEMPKPATENAHIRIKTNERERAPLAPALS